VPTSSTLARLVDAVTAFDLALGVPEPVARILQGIFWALDSEIKTTEYVAGIAELSNRIAIERSKTENLVDNSLPRSAVGDFNPGISPILQEVEQDGSVVGRI